MIIHLLDTMFRPEKGDLVIANCKTELMFPGSIGVNFDDGRLCSTCLNEHRKKPSSLYTFAFFEFETAEEANLHAKRTGFYPPLTPRNRQPTKPISVTVSPSSRIGGKKVSPNQ